MVNSPLIRPYLLAGNFDYSHLLSEVLLIFPIQSMQKYEMDSKNFEIIRGESFPFLEWVYITHFGAPCFGGSLEI